METLRILEYKITNVWQNLKRSTDKPCPVAGYVELVRDYSLIPQEGRFSDCPSQHLAEHEYRKNLITCMRKSFFFLTGILGSSLMVLYLD